MRMAKLAVVFDRKEAESRRSQGVNVFEAYIGEVLGRAGLPFEWIDSPEQLNTVNPDVAIAAFVREGATSASELWKYAENGGALIGLGNLGGLVKKLKATALQPIQPGYAILPEGSSAADGRPLRFLKATPWALAADNEFSAASLGTIGSLPSSDSHRADAILEFKVGAGTIDRWSVDILNTIVGLQQGAHPVFEDGIPAPDGTGAVDDGLLKADDGTTLDWELDRITTSTGQPYFAYPYADLWREALVGHILRTALKKGLALPFIGYWPDGVGGVAVISHDSDGNEDEAGLATLEILKECDIRSTWCMIEPGYSPSIYEAVKADGHELGFHYNAIDFPWSEEQFTSQFKWLQDAIPNVPLVSNKNHYTRLEGWGELFRWCEDKGIQSDQTRGPSKRGNVGVPFGTCHPYFPIAWCDEQNRIYNVLENGFMTQDMDLGSWADSSIIRPFFDIAESVDGIAHFLFHQFHIYRREEVRAAFRAVAKEARDRGFEFWTGQQVNDWERARRKVQIVSYQDGQLELAGHEEAAGLAVWVPLPAGEEPVAGETVIKFGVHCCKVT
ncbi:MAG: glycoside hydrolase/deacetylase [Paenibacillus sp.]|nr:glycoside hydrolase/deacetylase [Paenibacillus sp.]